jgi:hypothetical protein
LACTIEGAQKLCWSVPEWIARNAFFFLIPQLREMDESGAALAARLESAACKRASFVDLSDLLSLPENRRIWRDAIERGDRVIMAEDPENWNIPSAYTPFRASFAKLRLIAPLETAMPQYHAEGL